MHLQGCSMSSKGPDCLWGVLAFHLRNGEQLKQEGDTTRIVSWKDTICWQFRRRGVNESSPVVKRPVRKQVNWGET